MLQSIGSQRVRHDLACIPVPYNEKDIFFWVLVLKVPCYLPGAKLWWASLVAQMVKSLPAVWGTRV